eukprot:1728569-Pleurochrysis_carterae.AAC.1
MGMIARSMTLANCQFHAGSKLQLPKPSQQSEAPNASRRPHAACCIDHLHCANILSAFRCRDHLNLHAVRSVTIARHGTPS